MNAIAKIGLAAVLMLGASTMTIAQEAGAGVEVDAGASTDLKVKPGNSGAATGAGANMGIDAGTTGSVGGNFGSVISSLQSGSTPDLTAFDESATVNCIGVSTLQADGSNNAAALDNALSQNQSNVTTLQSSIQSNTALMSKLETSCAGIADFDASKIISVESGADGNWTFYVDDRTS